MLHFISYRTMCNHLRYKLARPSFVALRRAGAEMI